MFECATLGIFVAFQLAIDSFETTHTAIYFSSVYLFKDYSWNLGQFAHRLNPIVWYIHGIFIFIEL